MRAMRLLALCLMIVFFTSGCLVTKGAYDRLLSEKAAADSECRNLKKQVSDMRAEKDRKIAHLKDRTTTLEQEIAAVQAKCEHDMKLAGERQEALEEGLQALRQHSSEEKKSLLNQLEELSERYEAYKEAKDQEIHALNAGHRVEAETMNHKRTLEGLFNELEKQLKEEIEKGEIRLERRRTRIR